MAKAQRPTADELQRDEVAETLQEIAATLRRHRILLLGLAIAIVVGVIVFTAVRSHRNSVRTESNRLLADTLDYYGRLSQSTDEAVRAESLEGLLAATDQLHGAYGKTELGHWALFLKGRALYDAGQFAQAQAVYEQYIAEADTAEQRARGHIALAYAHENASFGQPNAQAQRSELDAARLNFEQARDLAPSGSYLAYYAMLGEARYYELTGNNDEAIALLERVVNERPAPQLQTADAAAETASPLDDDMSARLRAILREQESQASLQATARLRLERLRARAGLVVPELVTVETVESAPAADLDEADEPADAGATPEAP